MKKSKFTDAQIAFVLRQAEESAAVGRETPRAAAPLPAWWTLVLAQAAPARGLQRPGPPATPDRMTVRSSADVYRLGNFADIKGALRPLGAVEPFRRVIGDKAYDADSLRRWLAMRGTEAAIPSNATRRTPWTLRPTHAATPSSATSPHDTTASHATTSPQSYASPPSQSGPNEFHTQGRTVFSIWKPSSRNSTRFRRLVSGSSPGFADVQLRKSGSVLSR